MGWVVALVTISSLATLGFMIWRLSRDSWHGQRIGDALAVEIDDGVMDG